MTDISLFDEHRCNRRWFQKHYEELVRRFEGEHVAIHQEQVIDHDKNLRVLTKRVRKKVPSQAVFMHYVTREKIELILCG